MTLRNNRTKRIVTVKLNNGASQIAVIGEVSVPLGLHPVETQAKSSDSKASKILESSVRNNPTWLSGERSYEITRLESLLRGDLNEDERSIAEAMLSFHNQEQN